MVPQIHDGLFVSVFSAAGSVPSLRGDRIIDKDKVDQIMKKLPHPAALVKDAQNVLDMFPDLHIKTATHGKIKNVHHI